MATATTTRSMPDMPSIQAYCQPVETGMAVFETNAGRGLTTSEAQTRLARYGKNGLPATPPTPAWQRFLAQLQHPLTTPLLIATVISCMAWSVEPMVASPMKRSLFWQSSSSWLWLAIGVSVVLQIGVIHLPFLHKSFGIMPRSLTDWAGGVAVGSMVLWLRELLKLRQCRG